MVPCADRTGDARIDGRKPQYRPHRFIAAKRACLRVGVVRRAGTETGFGFAVQPGKVGNVVGIIDVPALSVPINPRPASLDVSEVRGVTICKPVSDLNFGVFGRRGGWLPTGSTAPR